MLWLKMHLVDPIPNLIQIMWCPLYIYGETHSYAKVDFGGFVLTNTYCILFCSNYCGNDLITMCSSM